jgi:hypothetical protein
MDPAIICCWVVFLLNAHYAHIAQLADKTKQLVHRISAPSPIAESLVSEIPTDTATTDAVTTIEYFTSSLPSATTTSAPSFLPTELPEQIPIETLAPGLSDIKPFLFATGIVFAVAALLWLAYHLGQNNPAIPSVRLYETEQLTFSWSEATVSDQYLALVAIENAVKIFDLTNKLKISNFAFETYKNRLQKKLTETESDLEAANVKLSLYENQPNQAMRYQDRVLANRLSGGSLTAKYGAARRCVTPATSETTESMPTPEPSSKGEGAAQIFEEEEVAPSVPTPTMDDVAALSGSCAIGSTRAPAVSEGGALEAPVTKGIEPDQPLCDRETEEPAAEAESDETPVDTASDDGASEAPVANEIELDQPIGDRETEEPTAEAESNKAHITTTGDDDASEGPVPTETKPGELASNRQPEELTPGVESNEVPGTTTSQDGAPRSTVTEETTSFEPLSDATTEPTIGMASDQPSVSEPMDMEDSNAPGESLSIDPMALDNPSGTTGELAAQAADQSSETQQFSGMDIDAHDEGTSNETQIPDPDDMIPESHDSGTIAPGPEYADTSNEMPQSAEDMDTSEQGGFAGGVAPRLASTPIETPQPDDIDMAGSSDDHGSGNMTAPVQIIQSEEIDMGDTQVLSDGQDMQRPVQNSQSAQSMPPIPQTQPSSWLLECSWFIEWKRAKTMTLAPWTQQISQAQQTSQAQQISQAQQTSQAQQMSGTPQMQSSVQSRPLAHGMPPTQQGPQTPQSGSTQSTPAAQEVSRNQQLPQTSHTLQTQQQETVNEPLPKGGMLPDSSGSATAEADDEDMEAELRAALGDEDFGLLMGDDEPAPPTIERRKVKAKGAKNRTYKGAPDNYLYQYPAAKGSKPAVTEILDWVKGVHEQGNEWITTSGLEGLSMMFHNPNSPLCLHKARMGWSVEFLENGREKWDLAAEWPSDLLDGAADYTTKAIASYEKLGKEHGGRDFCKPTLQYLQRMQKALESLQKAQEALR